MRRTARVSRSSTLLLTFCGVLGACAYGSGRAQDAPVPAEVQQQLATAMHTSAAAWNRGDLDGFLNVYRDDPQTAFMAPQITYGIAEIRARYARSYFKDGKPKGQLTYDDLRTRMLGPKHVLMTGRWHLTEPTGKTQDGYYTLVWELTTSGWKIVHDHSS